MSELYPWLCATGLILNLSIYFKLICEAENGEAYRVDTQLDKMTCEDVIDPWFFEENGCGIVSEDGKDLTHWKGLYLF